MIDNGVIGPVPDIFGELERHAPCREVSAEAEATTDLVFERDPEDDSESTIPLHFRRISGASATLRAAWDETSMFSQHRYVECDEYVD